MSKCNKSMLKMLKTKKCVWDAKQIAKSLSVQNKIKHLLTMTYKFTTINYAFFYGLYLNHNKHKFHFNFMFFGFSFADWASVIRCSWMLDLEKQIAIKPKTQRTLHMTKINPTFDQNETEMISDMSDIWYLIPQTKVCLSLPMKCFHPFVNNCEKHHNNFCFILFITSKRSFKFYRTTNWNLHFVVLFSVSWFW